MRAGNQNRRSRSKRLPPVLLPGSQQQLFGLVDLGGEVVRAPLVRMQLLHQGTVRPFDFASVRPRRHAKDLVGLLLRHPAAARGPRSLSLPRRRTILRVFTPTGLPAVKISSQ